MKKIKDIFPTILLVLLALIPGYFFFFFLGKSFLVNSEELEPVIMEEDVAGIFHGKLEEKVEFYPWNYFVPLRMQENESKKVKLEGIYLRDDIFHKLISEATGIELEKIQAKISHIQSNMVQGRKDNQPIDIYFYRKTFQIDGKKYRVKISCDKQSIISFTCFPVRETPMTLEEGFYDKKEVFLKELYSHPQIILEKFKKMYDFFYSFAREQEKLDIEHLMKQKNPIRVIELKNSLLLVIELEGEVTVGLYCDVLTEHITGFHFFYE